MGMLTCCGNGLSHACKPGISGTHRHLPPAADAVLKLTALTCAAAAAETHARMPTLLCVGKTMHHTQFTHLTVSSDRPEPGASGA